MQVQELSYLHNLIFKRSDLHFMTQIHILADENIPGLEALCGDWASISTRPGRAICAADLKNVDILFVRSVTSVDSALLDGSNVRFVGSATIGIDHLDIDYLVAAGIQYAHAPGSNANSVVDFVMSCILSSFDLQDIPKQTVGIIGAGNVGGRLANCLNHFGLDFLIYDPFVALNIPQQVSHLDELLVANVVSLHVPLSHSGDHPTWHMFDKRLLSRLSNHCLLINTSRGSVIDNQALFTCLDNGQSLRLAIDVWENEPNILWPLCQLAYISTPHIAGYSYPGKLRGSEQIVMAAQRFYRLDSSHSTAKSMFSLSNFDSIQDYHFALQKIYDVGADHASFHAQLELADNPSDCFDHFRKSYPQRDEISYDK